jgi:hypothetical protein
MTKKEIQDQIQELYAQLNEYSRAFFDHNESYVFIRRKEPLDQCIMDYAFEYLVDSDLPRLGEWALCNSEAQYYIEKVHEMYGFDANDDLLTALKEAQAEYYRMLIVEDKEHLEKLLELYIAKENACDCE